MPGPVIVGSGNRAGSSRRAVRVRPTGGKVVTFSVATSDRWTDKQSGEKREQTRWHNVAIFNDALAEVATRFLKKGSYVYLEGQLETRSWEKNGEKR